MLARTFKALYLLAFLMFTASVGLAGPVEDGIKYYKAKQYSQALSSLRGPANSGNAEAQYYLALMYAQGQGAAQSNSQALAWYRKSAEAGNAAAAVSLGLMYELGEGTPRNMAEAVRRYHYGAERGNAAAQNNMGNAYFNGDGVEKSHPLAAQWYKKSADNGNAAAATSLGVMYENGYAVAASQSEAFRWYKKGADTGNPFAMTNVGNAYLIGFGTPASHKDAFLWLKKAADQGHARAQYLLGTLYEDGKGTAQSYSQASHWYSKAAAQNWGGAQAKVTALAGKTPASANVAARKSGKLTQCHNGDAEACVEYGLEKRKTLSAGSRGEIYRLYEKGCGFDNGARACTMAAIGYADGKEVPQDLIKAQQLYSRACYTLDHADGCMLFSGFLLTHAPDAPEANTLSTRANIRACQLGKKQMCDALKSAGVVVPSLRSQNRGEISVSRKTCQTAYDDVLYRLGHPPNPMQGQTVKPTLSDQEMQWALKAETALQKGQACPPVPRTLLATVPPTTPATPSGHDQISNPAVTFSPTQIPQSDYEIFMRCAGDFDGAYALLERVTVFMNTDAKKKGEPHRKRSQGLAVIFAKLREKLPVMAPHLNRSAGQQAYNDGRQKYDTKAAASAKDQMLFYNQYSTITPNCKKISERLTGMQSIYDSAVTSLK